MTLASLKQRVRRFRHGAYLAGAALVACVAYAHASTTLAFGVLYFLVAPHVIAALQRWDAIRLQLAENVATSAVATLLGLPPVPATAIVAALLVGTVAQGGFASLLPAVATLVAGGAIGALARGQVSFLEEGPWLAEDPLSTAFGLVFLVVYATPLAALGYEQTMRMHRARNELHAKRLELERLCGRLSRYLAPSVYRQIVEDGSPTARLRRVYLTVCFVDLADFTGLTERLAPEELALLLNDFLLEVSACAASAGGTVDKFLGDGVLVYFGDPASRGPPADARACIEMARTLPARLATLQDRWRATGIDVRANVRIGVASGFCTLGDFGGGARLDHTVVGKPVNLASRLKDEARLGDVLASETVHVLLGDGFAADAVPRPVSVKGIALPVNAVALGVVDGVMRGT